MTLYYERFCFHQTLYTLAIYILRESFVNSDVHFLSFISYDNGVLNLFYFIDASGRTWRLKIRFWNSVSRGEKPPTLMLHEVDLAAVPQYSLCSHSAVRCRVFFNRCQIVILFGLFISPLSF